jgi:uncharacterized protein YdcH (DUF465 family)
MELADRMLVDRFMPQNVELRGLIEAHASYERDIEEFSGRSWLSDIERQRLRVLKKQKLRGRDRIEEILRGYRVEVAHG